MLSLRDPADETNDLGRKVTSIKHVQTTCQKLHDELERSLTINTRHSLLNKLVGPSYMLYKDQRKQLTEYGRTLFNAANANLANKAKTIRERELQGIAMKENLDAGVQEQGKEVDGETVLADFPTQDVNSKVEERSMDSALAEKN